MVWKNIFIFQHRNGNIQTTQKGKRNYQSSWRGYLASFRSSVTPSDCSVHPGQVTQQIGVAMEMVILYSTFQNNGRMSFNGDVAGWPHISQTQSTIAAFRTDFQMRPQQNFRCLFFYSVFTHFSSSLSSFWDSHFKRLSTEWFELFVSVGSFQRVFNEFSSEKFQERHAPLPNFN